MRNKMHAIVVHRLLEKKKVIIGEMKLVAKVFEKRVIIKVVPWHILPHALPSNLVYFLLFFTYCRPSCNEIIEYIYLSYSFVLVSYLEIYI